MEKKTFMKDAKTYDEVLSSLREAIKNNWFHLDDNITVRGMMLLGKKTKDEDAEFQRDIKRVFHYIDDNFISEGYKNGNASAKIPTMLTASVLLGDFGINGLSPESLATLSHHLSFCKYDELQTALNDIDADLLRMVASMETDYESREDLLEYTIGMNPEEAKKELKKPEIYDLIEQANMDLLGAKSGRSRKRG